MPQLLELQQTWTYGELEKVWPEDADPRSYEIVDGALVVSPAPGYDHEVVSALLRAQLHTEVPDGYLLLGPLGIEMATSYRVPDLVVATRSLYGQGRGPIAPRDALLAVEIVSPSSRTTDRVTKPAQYAAAGIPGYWRVETDPEVTLTAYALDPDASAYAELGTWGAGRVATIERPFPARIAIDQLRPQS